MLSASELTEEQKELLNRVKQGKNVLVDACIGSGKTTAIQVLCNVFPDKKILYLTYNRLLKIDAKNKIRSRNVTVTNYHGFAFSALIKTGVSCGVSDLIQVFNKEKPPLEKYDMLVLDEYQDIEQEIADMLEYIKKCNPNMQIVAVGDMKQKIYDKTTLDVMKFIQNFLEDYTLLNFTFCFRLCPALAKKLGNIWQKKIIGVNEDCHISQMSVSEVEEFLSEQNPKDILCLGSRTGIMAKVLNHLERDYPEKFNKSTVFASIRDDDGGSAIPTEKTAIFTTYDSSKGLERKTCVIFDYTEEYWGIRTQKSMVSYEIIRNIFCVAASRGKENIIFVQSDKDETPLSVQRLSTLTEEKTSFVEMDISTMFDFKYKEDVENCYRKLKITPVLMKDKSVINVKKTDSLIDLSPCIGIFQEAVFFENYDIDLDIAYSMMLHSDRPMPKYDSNAPVEDKILFLTSLETGQDRYIRQVRKPFVSKEQENEICARLSEVFYSDERVQEKKSLKVLYDEEKEFFIDGRCDVLTEDFVYELKFVSELRHEHFLQCACYMIAFGKEKGRLWNVRNNEMYEITIPDRALFLAETVKTVTKGRVQECVVLMNQPTRQQREKEIKQK